VLPRVLAYPVFSYQGLCLQAWKELILYLQQVSISVSAIAVDSYYQTVDALKKRQRHIRKMTTKMKSNQEVI